MPHDFTTGAQLDEDYVDPDLAGLDEDASAPTSDLEDLEAELTAEVAPTTVIRVDGRPGYAVRFRTDFTAKDLDLLRKRAKNKRMSDGIDSVKFAALLLAFTCEGIQRKGEALDLGDGKVATFTSPALQQLLKVEGADATVRKFYGLEGHVDAAARRLMAEAGWGDEADLADPTE